MESAVRRALQTDRVIDITTTGRATGEPRRIEMWFHNIHDRIFLTGTPGTRSWYANLVANPEFIFHLKESASADLAATARAVTAATERRAVLQPLLGRLGHLDNLEAWMARSPLIEVHFE
jgi:deazaflavin-dependent oxidoreductase (nitroreductase family)